VPRKKKLPDVPDYAPPERPGKQKAKAAGADAAPDLSHIVEGLHALAVPCDSLAFDPANARVHDEPNLEAIRGSLTVYRQCKPIVVRRDTNVVVAGNGTLQALLSLGKSYVAAVFVDMDAATAAGFSIADNRTSDLSEFDRDALDKLLREVNTANDERLDAMLASLAEDMKLIPGDPKPDAPPSASGDFKPKLKCPHCGSEFDAP
jgi:hypothetical protein